MSALVSTVQLRCPRECHHAHGNVDGRVRRAPRREYVKSSCARTPWPILMVNSAIFRAQRYQDDGMDGALPSGVRDTVGWFIGVTPLGRYLGNRHGEPVFHSQRFGCGVDSTRRGAHIFLQVHFAIFFSVRSVHASYLLFGHDTAAEKSAGPRFWGVAGRSV